MFAIIGAAMAASSLKNNNANMKMPVDIKTNDPAKSKRGLFDLGYGYHEPSVVYHAGVSPIYHAPVYHQQLPTVYHAAPPVIHHTPISTPIYHAPIATKLASSYSVSHISHHTPIFAHHTPIAHYTASYHHAPYLAQYHHRR